MSDSDRELLEWAAKAAGMHVLPLPWPDEDGWFYCVSHEKPAMHFRTFDRKSRIYKPSWLPLTEDGDIARLESALDIDVYWYKDHVSSHVVGRHFWVDEQYSDHGGDKNKARRYASTRAAAEIGRRA